MRHPMILEGRRAVGVGGAGPADRPGPVSGPPGSYGLGQVRNFSVAVTTRRDPPRAKVTRPDSV